MEVASVAQIKKTLREKDPQELLELCLRLAKFKKENKELLTYLLYEAGDEKNYIQSVKELITDQLEAVNRKNYYFIKKGIRKALKNLKKYIRYAQNKEVELDLLIFFAGCLFEFQPDIKRNTALTNLRSRHIDLIRNKVSLLHEDLQYDYELELKNLLKAYI